jgi:hypothetical protein
MKDVPGGGSGLLFRTVKRFGHGRDAQQVEEYRFDASLSRQICETLKQIAIEMGEWMERRDDTCGKPYKVVLDGRTV